MANRGFSDYNAAFVTLRKRYSNGLQFDFNYTFSHSIDNGSTVSNENGNFESGVTSVMCDVTNESACRGNSEFDVTHSISADFVYDLPFGRGKAFGHDVNRWVDEAIGGWEVSGIETWHTGFAFTANNTDIAFYDTVSLSADTGEIFNGPKSAVSSSIHLDKANNNEDTVLQKSSSSRRRIQPCYGFAIRKPRYPAGTTLLEPGFVDRQDIPSMEREVRSEADFRSVQRFQSLRTLGLPDTGV